MIDICRISTSPSFDTGFRSTPDRYARHPSHSPADKKSLGRDDHPPQSRLNAYSEDEMETTTLRVELPGIHISRFDDPPSDGDTGRRTNDVAATGGSGIDGFTDDEIRRHRRHDRYSYSVFVYDDPGASQTPPDLIDGISSSAWQLSDVFSCCGSDDHSSCGISLSSSSACVGAVNGRKPDGGGGGAGFFGDSGWDADVSRAGSQSTVSRRDWSGGPSSSLALVADDDSVDVGFGHHRYPPFPLRATVVRKSDFLLPPIGRFHQRLQRQQQRNLPPSCGQRCGLLEAPSSFVIYRRHSIPTSEQPATIVSATSAGGQPSIIDGPEASCSMMTSSSVSLTATSTASYGRIGCFVDACGCATGTRAGDFRVRLTATSPVIHGMYGDVATAAGSSVSVIVESCGSGSGGDNCCWCDVGSDGVNLSLLVEGRRTGDDFRSAERCSRRHGWRDSGRLLEGGDESDAKIRRGMTAPEIVGLVGGVKCGDCLAELADFERSRRSAVSAWLGTWHSDDSDVERRVERVLYEIDHSVIDSVDESKIMSQEFEPLVA